MANTHLESQLHPLSDTSYVDECREVLDRDGALVLKQFVRPESIARIVTECAPAESAAFYAGSTHNVYLTPPDTSLPDDHSFNRQILSSKGLIADDQIPADSPLRDIYQDDLVRSLLCGVLGIEEIHPYADDLSSVNVHYAAEGMELGWHFDNSSFAVTMLLQAPEGGGRFEHVPSVRNSADGAMAFDRVASILDGDVEVQTLEFEPGDLVLFRGRDALHRVTPTEGSVTRMLVVFAFNDEPGVALSDSALNTFYGRTR
jgi:hypothetical protein